MFGSALGSLLGMLKGALSVPAAGQRTVSTALCPTVTCQGDREQEEISDLQMLEQDILQHCH